jgi:hypothetical protein
LSIDLTHSGFFNKKRHFMIAQVKDTFKTF